MSQTRQATLRRVKRHDRWAGRVVSLGGAIVIVSVLGILILILGTTLPLFYPATARVLGQAALPASLPVEDVLALGIQSAANDSWLVAHVIDPSGRCHFVDLLGKETIAPLDANQPAQTANSKTAGVKKPAARRLLGAAASGSSTFTLRWSDGSVSLVRIVAKTEQGGKLLRAPKFTLENLAAIPPDKLGLPEQAILRRTGEDSSRCAAIYNHGKQIVVTRQSEDLSGDKTETRIVLEQDIPAPVSAITLDRTGTMLYAGTISGSILWWRLDDERVVDHDIAPPSLEKHAITSLALMLGDVTLVAGDDDGQLTSWFFVKPASELQKKKVDSGKRGMVKEVKKLTYIRSLATHESAIREIVPSPRNRALLIHDESSMATMDYTTSQRQLLTFSDISKIAFNSRGDVVAGLVENQLKVWRIEGSLFGLLHSKLYPEVSWSSLWGRVWYEGLNEPEFSWQPHGDEEYESKLSLVPLVFGTLKGTFYAMLLAAPLALGAAAYVSHFTTPYVRTWVKPAIEMMAAVPSVVLGFLVGLWLAPLIDDWLLAFFMSLVAVPLALVVFLLIWQWARRSPTAEKAVRGREFLVTSLLIVVGLATAGLLSAPVERAFFGDNLVRWMSSTLGVVYVQRNSILIAFGVGFMVIPMIFTLAEDSLSSVPHSMTAASMALGASRWQTLWRVVLPSASPGIFAAVMIGFGRAVGETMVFLMATGNTPLISLNPLNGMRTLSANIAEEIPGAPLNGTLYRTLFLCAVILFIMTFFLNTIAEVVRQRLRKRFGQF
jgi:phosphate transport system permease protein